jgi:hypothetical protein
MASWFANFVVFELCLLMVVAGYLFMAGWMKDSWGRIIGGLVILQTVSLVVPLIEPRLQQLGIWRYWPSSAHCLLLCCRGRRDYKTRRPFIFRLTMP